jgi:hypothetical protein
MYTIEVDNWSIFNILLTSYQQPFTNMSPIVIEKKTSCAGEVKNV